MVSASSARPRFPRPACRSCRTRPTVSSAPKKSSVAKTTAPGQSPSRSATPGSLAPLPRSRYVVYGLIAAGGCAADLITKQVVFHWLGIHEDFLDKTNPAVVTRWRGDPQLDHLFWLWDRRFGFQT